VSYAGAAEALVLDLAAQGLNAGAAAGDVLLGIEEVVGTGLQDRLAGDGLANVFRGEAGSDWLSGARGMMRFTGARGMTRFWAGRGLTGWRGARAATWSAMPMRHRGCGWTWRTGR
jgi:hypothetical protein